MHMCRLRPAMPCSLWLRASLAVAALSCCWLRCEAAIPTAGPQHVVPGNGSYFGVTMVRPAAGPLLLTL